jgi:hypothetical protein
MQHMQQQSHPHQQPQQQHPQGVDHHSQSIQAQLDYLRQQQQGMSQHMANIANDYQMVMGEMMNFQRNMVAQDQLMQNLIQYLVNLEAGSSPLCRVSSAIT